MGLFSGFGDKPVFGQGQYMTPGTYTLKIKECKTFKSMQNSNHFFCVEFEVIEATYSEQERQTNERCFEAGQEVSWLVNFAHQSSASNIKLFVANGVFGCDPDDIPKDEWEAKLEGLVSPQNPAAGTVIKTVAYHVPTRSGGTFTKHSWQHVSRPAA